jgi:hypothetical protein
MSGEDFARDVNLSERIGNNNGDFYYGKQSSLSTKVRELIQVKSTSPVVSTSKSSTSGLLALGHSEYQASKQASQRVVVKQASTSFLKPLGYA